MDENELERLTSTGIFGESHIDATSHISLNALLSCPFFWNSSKIYDFFRDSWNCIKNREDVEEIKQFKDELKEEHECVFSSDSDWISVLGDEHWAILQTDGAKSKTPNRMRNASGNCKNVIQLLRLIRNKAEHPENYGEEEQRILQWYIDGQFDNHEFVMYWLNRFPRVLPFLWLKFYNKFKDRSTLRAYYPCSLDNYTSTLYCSLRKDTIFENAIDQICLALDRHLEEGGLVKRYICTRHDASSSGEYTEAKFTLEFMAISPEAINRLLNGSSYVKIEVQDNTFSFKWNDPVAENKESVIKYSARKTFIVKCPADESDAISIVVANNIGDHNLGDIRGRLIFLISQLNKDTAPMQATVEKFASLNHFTFCEKPLAFSEVDRFKRLILDEGEVRFQNKVFKLSCILPENVEDTTSMLYNLKGNTLNELLAKGKPTLFEKIKMPQLPKTYLKRRLRSFREVTSKVLRHHSTDIFVVIHIMESQLKSMLSEKDKLTILVVPNVNDILNTTCANTRIFLLEQKDCQFKDILEQFKSLFLKDDKSIHYIRYLREETFLWLGTYGSLSVITKSFIKKPSEFVVIDESDFLMTVENEKCGSIFIADKPGMGKSLTFISLANQMSEKFGNSFVGFFNMNDFIVSLDNRLKNNRQKTCKKTDIIFAIQEKLSSTEFEKSLITYWLEQSLSNHKITFELMFDGLDEVGQKHKNLAMTVLKIIRQELPSVRLWVTLREHMQEEIEKHLSAISYKIEPLSEDDQVKFLQNYWSGKLETSNKFDSRAVRDLALRCLQLTSTEINASEIAGAPLQCYMLAEIYENDLPELLSGTSSLLENISLTNLYEKMIDKHLKVYLEEKEHIPNPTDDIFEMSRQNMELWHIYLAIKLLFPDWLTESFCAHFNITSFTVKCMESTVKKQGIVENYNPVRFVHRTYAEYFVAVFICKVFLGEFPKMDNQDVKAFEIFFYSHALEVSKYQYSHDPITKSSRSCSKFKHPVLCYFLSSMLEDVEISFDFEKSLDKIYDFDPNLKEFDSSKSVILATLHHNYFPLTRLLLDSLSSENKRKFLGTTKDLHEFLLDVTIRNSSSEVFTYMCSLIEEWHANNGSPYKVSETLFTLALTKGKCDIVKILVEEKGFGPEKWEDFQSQNKKKLGIIHHIIGKSRHDKEVVLEEKKKLLEYIVQIDSKTLEAKDDEGRTPILFPIINVPLSLRAYLATKLGANVNATGIHRNTAFHWKSYGMYRNAFSPREYHQMLETFLNSGFSKINLANDTGCTPLHCAIKTYCDSLRDETLDLFKKAGADFDCKDGDGNTVLHVCIQRKLRIDFIEKLIECGSKIDTINSEGLCAIHLAIKNHNYLLVKILVEKFEANLEVCDSTGKSVQEYVAESTDEIRNYFRLKQEL